MNKKNIIPIALLVVVCALLLGAYALQRTPRTSDGPVVPLPERLASTTIPFNTYTNSALGVSFSKPTSWEVVSGEQVRLESPDFAEETVPDTNGKRVVTGSALSLEKGPFLVDSSEEYALLIEEIHEDPECGNCLTGYPITIDEVPAYLGFASSDASMNPNGAIISFVSGGNQYRLLISFASYTPLNQEILAEVISTFTLTQ